LELVEPLERYFEKLGTLVLLLSPLNGLSKVDEEAAASRRAGDELMVRSAVVVVPVVAAGSCRREDRARARDTVERGAIVKLFREPVMCGYRGEEDRRESVRGRVEGRGRAGMVRCGDAS
jgi:hypothetical protein